eukprot:CAMPEP_0197590200 /NCGR_PEP_ID=MMETSP1326-20131121/10871_1 /TAXON_ID=1155430 /ORGANISM="Genus nov. species nov., Strain RCC2288" /LENGTH=31 /DNA_ID= /DNA_START= /DNA_END= /DNA_ORIENTATION=
MAAFVCASPSAAARVAAPSSPRRASLRSSRS